MKKYILIFYLVLYISGCGQIPDNQSQINNNPTENFNYGENLKSVISEIINQSSIAEDMINMYLKVWDYNIKMTLDQERFASVLGISTNDITKYITKPPYSSYYAFKGDFETAIMLTQEYFTKTNKIVNLENGSNLIINNMKELNAPPENYTKAFELSLELYSLYEEFITLAISPSGSLMTYSQKTRDLSSNIVKKYKEFEIIVPTE